MAHSCCHRRPLSPVVFARTVRFWKACVASIRGMEDRLPLLRTQSHFHDALLIPQSSARLVVCLVCRLRGPSVQHKATPLLWDTLRDEPSRLARHTVHDACALYRVCRQVARPRGALDYTHGMV